MSEQNVEKDERQRTVVVGADKKGEYIVLEGVGPDEDASERLAAWKRPGMAEPFNHDIHIAVERTVATRQRLSLPPGSQEASDGGESQPGADDDDDKFCPACRAGGDAGEHQRGCLVASVARGLRQEKDSVDVDRWSRHLLHTSQHNGMPIFLGGRLQEQANEMRRASGLEPFGWGDTFPDAEFGECSVHSNGCAGQETHAPRLPSANPTDD